MTPEGKVKQDVKALLKKHGAYWHMPVQNGMGDPALDFHVCHRGRYLGIETKRPGGVLTPRQEQTRRRIEAAGGTVLVIDGTNLEALEFWLLMGGSNDGAGDTTRPHHQLAEGHKR